MSIANTSANSHLMRNSSSTIGGDIASFLLLAHVALEATKRPMVANRACRASGQLDWGGMHERRESRKLTKSELILQRRSIDQAAAAGKKSQGSADHPQQTPAGRPSSHLVQPASVTDHGWLNSITNTIANTIAFQIGPPGCEAASMPSARQSADIFSQKHSNGFQVFLNKRAKNAKSMAGMIVLVVETYSDKASAQNVARVLSDYRRTQGDRFFVEGGIKKVCTSRSQRYGIALSDCQLMERGSSNFDALEVADRKVYLNLITCLNFMKTYVPELRHQPIPEFTDHARLLLLRHLNQIPPDGQQKLYALLGPLTDSMQEFERKANLINGERAKQMASFIRENRSTDGINYVVISRGQEEHLPNLLTDLTCITLASLPQASEHKPVTLKPAHQQKQEL